MELRLAELLDKLGAVAHAGGEGGDKVRELERELQALTQQRLDFLEQQQLNYQVRKKAVDCSSHFSKI